MYDLKELVDIVTLNKVKSISVIGNQSEKDTKLMKLYNGIRQCKINTDEEAIHMIYKKEAGKSAYYKLKHTLKNRLIDTLFFIDTKKNKFSDKRRAYFICYKEMLAILTLVNRGARVTAVKMAEKLIKTTIKFEFTRLTSELTKLLSRHYANIEGDRKKYTYYSKLTRNYAQLSFAETLAEDFINDILSQYVIDKSEKSELAIITGQYFKILKEIELPTLSSNYIFMMGIMEIYHHMITNDYVKTIELCNSYLKNLEGKESTNITALSAIHFQKIACCIQLQKYQEGKKSIDFCFTLLEEGTFNWFKSNEMYLSLCLHTQEYQLAWQTFKKVTSSTAFHKLPPSVGEPWKIYEAWLNLLIAMEKIKIDSVSNKVFKISRFMNEVPIFSKDKRGLNVPILILQTLFQLQQRKYNHLIDRIEALSKYQQRYLCKEENYRSYVFIKMLIEIPKAYFNKNLVIQKTEKWSSQLRLVPIEISNQNHDLEILPYQHIWTFVLDLLDKRSY